MYFYVVGNFQGFSDNTLVFLFAVESWILSLCAITGVFSTITYIATLKFRNQLFIDKIILSAAASIFSVLFYLLVAILQVFMESYS